MGELFGGIVFTAFVLFILKKVGYVKIEFGDFRKEKKSGGSGGTSGTPGNQAEK